MARNKDFYQGRRQRRNYWLIPFILLLGLITLLVVLFYGLQKYAVISDKGVRVSFTDTAVGGTGEGDADAGQLSFDTVIPEIVFQAPDYSRVQAVAGKNVRPVRAVYISAGEVTIERLQNAAANLVDGNALMIEMKPRNGQLLWNSKSPVAVSYGSALDNEFSAQLETLIPALKEREDGKRVWLVAQISCFIDELLANRSNQYALRSAAGFNFTDENGSWLDPYNPELRNYIVDLVRELYDLGFDEVVLADVAHPSLAEAVPLLYTREISTPRSTVAAVCGLAAGVADKLRDREKVLSIYCKTREALVRDDFTTGQNAVLFMRLYDRVYLETDKYTYSYNVEDIANNVRVGNVYDRLVPVVVNYIPDNTSWVLVDGPEE